MPDQVPRKKPYKDDWDTDFREAYEDRGPFRSRAVKNKRRENRLLGSVGALMIVGGICWGVYMVTAGRDTSALTRFPGPVYVAGAGLLVSILSKLFN